MSEPTTLRAKLEEAQSELDSFKSWVDNCLYDRFGVREFRAKLTQLEAMDDFFHRLLKLDLNKLLPEDPVSDTEVQAELRDFLLHDKEDQSRRLESWIQRDQQAKMIGPC